MPHPLLQTTIVKPFGELLAERLALKVGRGLKYQNLREFAKASGAHFSTISQCSTRGLAPPLQHLSGLADALDLAGDERDTFVRAGKRAKAISQAEAWPYIESLEAELTVISRFSLLLVGKAIKKGIKLDQEAVEMLRLIEQRL